MSVTSDTKTKRGTISPFAPNRDPVSHLVDRPARRFRLLLTGLSTRVGVERATFAIEMLSPVLAALAPDEHLSLDIVGAGDGARLTAALGGLVRAADVAGLEARAGYILALLESLARVQLPGFRMRRVVLSGDAGAARAIVPRGRVLASDALGDREPGPTPVKGATDELVLPPLQFAPERVMAAAQIVAAEQRPLTLSMRLALKPIDARLLRLLIEQRRLTERQDADTHIEAMRLLSEAVPDHKYLSALIDEGQAVHFTLHAESPDGVDDTTARVLCHALFAAAPAPGDADLPRGDNSLVGLYPRSVALPPLMAGLALTAAYSFQRPEPRYVAPTRGARVLLGTTADGEPVSVTDADRAQHTVAIGATGTGKTTMLLNQMQADMEAGKGLILVDPHGDLWQQALSLVPLHRRGDIVAGHLGEPERSFSMNVLAGLGGDPAIERSATVNGLVRLFKNSLWPGVPEAFGPMFELYFRNAMLLLMEAEGEAATILDFERVFQDEDYREQLIRRCRSENVRDFWRKTVEKTTYHEISIDNIAPYIICKFAPFTTNALLRPVLGSKTSSLDLGAAIAGRKIVLLNLAKGIVGEGSARLVGSLVTMRLVSAAQMQMKLPERARVPFVAYLDEFQTYATEYIAEAIEETRKYKLSLVLACQSLGQVDGRAHRSDVGRSIVANVANLIAFRLGVEDAAVLAKWFEPDVSAEELMYLPNYSAVARLMVEGQALRPVEFRAAPPPA